MLVHSSCKLSQRVPGWGFRDARGGRCWAHRHRSHERSGSGPLDQGSQSLTFSVGQFQSLRPALWRQPLTPAQLQCIRELSGRRLQRMPVQYVLGEWDFQGLSLKMAPPVFIPRPETEELVEWVLEEVAPGPCVAEAQGGPLILEVGCGSGAISLSLLSRLPQSRAVAVDKGAAAVCLTRENAQRLRLQDRIHIVPLDVTSEGSWAHLLPWGPLDLIVSNPPYVFRQDMEQLAPEIRSYEDPAALDGGEKGMDIIERILALAPRLLKDSGSIFLEVDPRHPELVGGWLQSRPDLSLQLVAVRRDFCGRPRFLHVRRSGAPDGCPVDVQPGPPPARAPG
ncbi:HemK methyltransferase family member 1 [Phyllostomus discolor]|uniref:peptide chain release factor N(5)-glutamine methyltransferase n=1 Tax=Phyllostomus discolor TaxID=89673 RepID=A0A833ZT89_9CHIR|nr:HemK methyltransferase family member 1 [Phyllostomus discolor]